jgi:hypothetical protein
MNVAAATSVRMEADRSAVAAPRTGVIVTRAAMVLAVVLTAMTLVLTALTRSGEVEPLSGSDVQDAGLALAFLAYSTVGAVIVCRRPGNRVGWMFLTAGLLLLVWACSYRYAAYGVETRTVSTPGTSLAAWLAAWTLIPGFGVAFALLPMVFPTGRLATRRQRPVAWLAAFAVGFATISWATVPGPLDVFDQFTNLSGSTSSAGWGSTEPDGGCCSWLWRRRRRRFSFATATPTGGSDSRSAGWDSPSRPWRASW